MNKKAPGLDTIHDLFATRLPILIWVSMVYVGTVILQFLNEPLILQACVFTGLFTVHVLLHWNVYRVTPKQYWFYFSIQAVLIYLCAILMPGGYQVVLIGLLPVMIAQSLGFSFRIKRILFVSVISLFLFFDAALTIHDTGELLVFLPLFALMLIIVIAYGILFFRQVQERLRIQSFLHELEEAHSKVEELTLSNERQRMARDLHDTLAQGVAGMIMQLEAADAHMTQGNGERAQRIVRQTQQQARRTLAEARRAIDDLRRKSGPDVDFREAVAEEVRHFREATGIPVEAEVKLSRPLSGLVMEHSLHMVREGFTNIARHARASEVRLGLSDRNGLLQIEMTDNGRGFQAADIGRDPGHYGLLGIRERARLMGGDMTVSSTGKGTEMRVTIPLDESEKP